MGLRGPNPAAERETLDLIILLYAAIGIGAIGFALGCYAFHRAARRLYERFYL